MQETGMKQGIPSDMSLASDAILGSIRAIEEDIGAGKLREATEAVNALVAVAPLDPRVCLCGALLARAAGDPAQEVLALQRAVEVAPRWPPAHMELAKAFSRQGRHDNAMKAANKAVELAPQEMSAIEIAVAVANAADDAVTAQRHLQAALALRPGDIAISRALGMCLNKQRRFAEAEPHWRSVLAVIPDDVSALGWLGICLMGLNRKQEARALLERAKTLSPDHPTLPFYLAVARGETPPTQPREMVQQLFDAYANRFDKHLVEDLNYRVPSRVAQIIRERRGIRDVSVLDLGCGTGLLGAHLGHIPGAFVGVDVSPRMLERAAKLGIYSELRQNDLLDELRRTSMPAFDFVVANDVFIYVGDLTQIIPSVFNVLRSGGTLIFSCETADASEGSMVLRPSKRYAHSRASVEALCHDAGFNRFDVELIDLRLDAEAGSIAGFIATATKP
jgi:predicted TPR repeat methyltransferase